MKYDILLCNVGWTSDIMPWPIMVLGTYLSKKGKRVRLMDGFSKQSDILAEAAEARFVGFSVMTAQIPASLKLTKELKKLYPEKPIIWGGVHPSLFPEQTLKEACIDFIIHGDGEYALYDLLETSGKDISGFKHIDGLGYKTDEGIKINPMGPLVDFKDAGPWNFDLLDMDNYMNWNLMLVDFKTPSISFLTSRGCPKGCTFCINSALPHMRVHRPRPVESLLDEIESLIERYHVKTISFPDEVFFMNRKYFESFIDGVIDRNLKFEWGGAACISDILRNRDLILKAKSAGLIWLGGSGESGNDRLLKLLKKGITVSDIYECASFLADNNIMLVSNYMIQIPTETPEETKATLNIISDLKKIFIKKNNPSFIQGPSVFRPYPGTKLYQICRESGFKEPERLEDWNDAINFQGYYNYGNITWSKSKIRGYEEQRPMMLSKLDGKERINNFNYEFELQYAGETWKKTEQIAQNISDEEKRAIDIIKHLRKCWGELGSKGVKKLAVFGAGQHTSWLERILSDVPSAPQITAILDDTPSSEKKFWGLSPEKPSSVDKNTFDAILLSTDSIPEVFASRCKTALGDIRLIDLYEDIPGKPCFKLPPACKDLYIQTKRIRMVEEEIAKRYHEQKMRCPVHLSVGQEAVAAGVCTALDKNDLVLSGHRAHAHYLAKGGNLPRMLAEIYGKSTGCCGGKGGSMHLIDNDVGFKGSTAIVGGTIPLAVGLGLSLKLKGSKNIACIFLGDGAVEEGVFYESINFAVLKKLPILFICENNNYSVYSHINKRQPHGRRIADMVNAMGCATACCNGNNPLSVYQLSQGITESIREGAGPHFLEFSTYRWREHCGPNYDHELKYRDDNEFLYWKGLDPVLWMEFSMLEQSLVKKNDIQDIETSLIKEINEAFEFAEKSPFPSPENAYEKIYKG